MDPTTFLGLLHVTGSPAPDASSGPRRTFFTLVSANPYNFDGAGFLSGDVAIDGDPADDTVPDVPVPALVRLYRDSDGALVKSTTSAPLTGAWRFDRLNMAYTYTALAYWPGYRAVAADGVRPLEMP